MIDDENSFASLHEIEQMWGKLRAGPDKIYSDMIQDMLGKIDESELVCKKTNIKKMSGQLENLL